MSYRFINPAPVLFNLAGTEPAAGGSLTFYERGTTTDKDTWSDEAMGDPNLNENPVPLDSSGRANTEIWLDGEYTCVLKDSLGATIWTRDLVSEAGTGTSLPALTTDYFLSNDGTNLLWAAIRQVPDPTGQANKVLSNDGSNLLWMTPETVEQPDFASTSTSWRAGPEDGTHFFVQSDTDSAPASGSVTTSATVTFDTPFTTIFNVVVTVTSNSQPGGPVVSFLTADPTTTGFTVMFDIAEGAVSGANFANPVPFRWTAFGLLSDPT